MNNKEGKYWVWLASTGEIGAKSFKRILSRFESIEEVFKTDRIGLLRRQIPEKLVDVILSIKAKNNADIEEKRLKNLNIGYVTIKDDNYPLLLKEIPDAPAVLYYRGEMLADEVGVAIVGSRKYTPYGKRVTEKISSELVRNKISVISGLALGIDTFAHKTALEYKGRTIGVLANGLDMIYPLVNTDLARKIISSGGAIISEFPPGVPALRHNFPIRNRIIAGLTLGTVVVEAAKKSGSLITANCALDYNREVFAVPGSIYSLSSEGTNNLIKNGAKVVTTIEDVLEELNLEKNVAQDKARDVIADSKEEAIIIEYLSKDDPVHIDKIKKLTKLNIATLNSKITLMEIKGKIKNIGANNYVLRG